MKRGMKQMTNGKIMKTEIYRKATISYEPQINSEHPFRVTITEKDSEILGLSVMKIIRTVFFETEKEALALARKYKVNKISRAENMKDAKNENA